VKQKENSETENQPTQEELVEIYRKYHPQEQDNTLAVDYEYKKRLEKVFGVKVE
jgi:hypothetical protein